MSTPVLIHPAILEERIIGTLPDSVWRTYIELCLLSAAYIEQNPQDTLQLPPFRDICWYLRKDEQTLIDHIEFLESRNLVSSDLYNGGEFIRVITGPNIKIGYSPQRITSGWTKVRLEVLERDDYICRYCGDIATAADHIFPQSLGGEDRINNLVAACKSCNSSKKDRLVFEWYKDQPFFDQDRWDYIQAVQNDELPF